MTDARHPFVERWFQATRPEPAVPWVSDLRGAAFDRFSRAEVPTRKHEEWRFFDLRPIVDSTWTFAGDDSVDAASFERDDTGVRLVLTNGVLDRDASSFDDSAGFAAGGLADLDDEARGAIVDLLGSATRGLDDDLFCAANTAFFRDAACVVIPPDTLVEHPIHIVVNGTEAGAAHHPRIAIVVGRGSKATVLEEYRGAEQEYFTNAVTEVLVGESANLHHVRVQRDDNAARHVARVGARVQSSGSYDSVHVTLGAASSRTDVWLSHEGEDAWARVDGLAMVDGKRETDTHSVIDNTRPRCTSHQLHKCVVDDQAHAVFNGKIFVREGAQKIDAYQLNRNLLLSNRARVDTKPQLEIFTDDVECTHGATVGQLDEEQLFYLVSRGYTPEVARATLTYAFAAEVINEVKMPALARELEQAAHARIMQG
jgi:Fe-S cluster assembly protein SufD